MDKLESACNLRTGPHCSTNAGCVFGLCFIHIIKDVASVQLATITRNGNLLRYDAPWTMVRDVMQKQRQSGCWHSL